MIWRHSLLEIILFINGKLVYLENCIFVENIFEFRVKWKNVKRYVQEIRLSFYGKEQLFFIFYFLTFS